VSPRRRRPPPAAAAAAAAAAAVGDLEIALLARKKSLLRQP